MRTSRANGSINEISSDALMQLVDNLPFSVVAFIEKGNYECQLQMRALRELAKDYKSKVFFAKVDVNREAELSETFEIEDLPTLFFIMQGEEYSCSEERMTKTECREEIEEMIHLYV